MRAPEGTVNPYPLFEHYAHLLVVWRRSCGRIEPVSLQEITTHLVDAEQARPFFLDQVSVVLFRRAVPVNK